MLTPEELMQLAIDKSREGIAGGQTPFGCAIARGDELLAAEHNTVLHTTDITAHAEVNALRSACQTTGEIFLGNAIVATTCEPCPMCMAALHWARVEVVYFGAAISDAEVAGFNELSLGAAELLRHGQSPVKLVANVLAEECRLLFEEWKQSPGARAY